MQRTVSCVIRTKRSSAFILALQRSLRLKISKWRPTHCVSDANTIRKYRFISPSRMRKFIHVHSFGLPISAQLTFLLAPDFFTRTHAYTVHF